MDFQIAEELDGIWFQANHTTCVCVYSRLQLVSFTKTVCVFCHPLLTRPWWLIYSGIISPGQSSLADECALSTCPRNLSAPQVYISTLTCFKHSSVSSLQSPHHSSLPDCWSPTELTGDADNLTIASVYLTSPNFWSHLTLNTVEHLILGPIP